jgi:hypothetical protein
MEARVTKVARVAARISKALAKRRLRPNQVKEGFERSAPQVISTFRARRTRSAAKCAAISQVGMCVTSHSFLDYGGDTASQERDVRSTTIAGGRTASQVNGARDGQRRHKSTQAVFGAKERECVGGTALVNFGAISVMANTPRF